MIKAGGAASVAVAEQTIKWDSASTKESRKKLKNALDTSNNYRFVRFLPDRIFAGATNKKVLSPFITGADISVDPYLTLKSKDQATNIYFFFIP